MFKEFLFTNLFGWSIRTWVIIVGWTNLVVHIVIFLGFCSILLIITTWPDSLRDSSDPSGKLIFPPDLINFIQLVFRFLTVLRWVDIIFGILLLVGIYYKIAIFILTWMVYTIVMSFLKMFAGLFKAYTSLCIQAKPIGFLFLLATIIIIGLTLMALLIVYNFYQTLEPDPQIP